MTVTTKDLIAGAVSSLKDEAASLRKREQVLKDNRPAIYKLMAPLLKAHEAGLLNWEPSLSVGNAYPGYTISIYATMQGLDGLKDQRLLDLLDCYMHAAEMKTTDYPSSLNRDFRFTFPLVEKGFSLVVSIGAYVREDSATCRKVLKSVSSRVVEDKEYELVCD